MIPSEILKNIRQIELRTNRIVTGFAPGARLWEPQHCRWSEGVENSESVLSGEAAAGRRPARRSFEPSPQFRRIQRTVPDGKNLNLAVFGVDGEVNRVRPRFGHLRFVRQSRCQPKPFGIVPKSSEKGLKFVIESLAHTSFLGLIPVHCLIPLLLGFGLRNDVECHFLASRRFLISAETSSTGVPRPGFFSASSARRSSSAICSGVSASSKLSNFSRRRSKTSRCSSNGSFSTCSKTWVALMAELYAFDLLAQAGVSPGMKLAISP